jgi:S1-C subfamily serine protease
MEHLLSHQKTWVVPSFFRSPITMAQLKIFIKFWEKFGKNLGRKNITNIILNHMNKKKGEKNMDEITTPKRKSKNGYIAGIIALAIVAMFIVGYIAGGSLNSSATTSTQNTIQQQVENQQSKTTNEAIHNITYYYNTTSLAHLYESSKNSVVVITGLIQQYSFFGMSYSTVQGSGFVYDYQNEMVVITNKHVVSDATNITVTFSNGDAYPATVIGSDAYSDLAVLSVQAAPLDEFHPLEISSSSSLQVGDPVVAIGSPFGLGGTMTTGIISQMGRTIQDSVAGNFPIANIIQTSVPINPGNSGGPLLNYQGEVVGITTAIIQNSNGLGFAIPSNTILREIDSLINQGTYTQHSWLGISGDDMGYAISKTMGVDVTYGWLITQVTNGGAADNAGLQGGNQQVRIGDQWIVTGGDIIIAVDGTRVINGDSFMSYLEENTVPHQIISLTIIRNHQQTILSVELGQRPTLN